MRPRPILLADENPINIELARQVLESGRIANEIVIARNGEEALDCALGTGPFANLDSSHLPGLVLLDPEVVGDDGMRRIRENAKTRAMSVVMLTPSNEEQAQGKSAEGIAGCNKIQKPVDWQQLAKAIQQSGLYWLVVDEPPSSTHHVP